MVDWRVGLMVWVDGLLDLLYKLKYVFISIRLGIILVGCRGLAGFYAVMRIYFQLKMMYLIHKSIINFIK